MRPSLGLAHALLAPCLLAGLAHAQSVWIVDAAGGGDFTDLPAAVAAAQGGDVLLLKSGSYSHVQMYYKGLSLLAEPGESVIVDGLNVTVLRPDQFLLVRGIEFVEQSGAPGPCVGFAFCLGPVWLEDCVVRFATGAAATTAGPALTITACASATLVDCEVLGRTATSYATSIGYSSALLATSSDVCAQRTTLVGPKGYPATLLGGTTVVPPSPGGAGVIAVGHTVFLYDCQVVGGEGGDGDILLGNCVAGASGGVGLSLPYDGVTDGVVYTAATQPHGGAPGAAAPGCSTGTVGADHLVLAGTIVDTSLDGEPRVLSAPVTVREGQTLDLTFTGGVAGELVQLGLSFGSAQAFLPQFEGAVVLAATIHVSGAGVMPPSGPLVASYPIPDLPPGMMGLPLFLQSLHLGLEPHLGTGVAIVVLDSTF